MGKEIWAVPCWYFFHGFAARINANFYRSNYKTVWKNIYVNLCLSLPCPMCRQHATKYIKNGQYSDIDTKEKLIKYVFKFHNYVNSQLGKPLFKYDNIDVYERLRMKQCYFMVYKSFTRDYSRMFNGWLKCPKIKMTTDYLLKIWNNIE
jgi:hypothetical protein